MKNKIPDVNAANVHDVSSSVSESEPPAKKVKLDLTPNPETWTSDAGPLGGLSALTAPPGIDRERAALVITRALRKNVAIKAQQHMFADGKLWTKLAACRGPLQSVDRLSKQNIWRLRQELKTLSEQESKFFDVLTRQKYYATHFTNANVTKPDKNVASLYSRQKLISRGISFPKENTSKKDIKEGACDDYVFCSLECGEETKKPTSRFGDTMLRFDLDSAQFTHAWLSMNDMVQPKESTLERYFTDLDDADYEYAKDMVEYYNSPDFVFSGRDMIPGAALSVIHATRDLTEKAKAQILNASDEYASNNAINGLFRPEIKIPRFLITGKFQKISSK